MAGRRNTELVPGGTAARLDPSYEQVVGREKELGEVHARLRDPDGPRLIVVRGERGVGRSAFVRTLGERLRTEGVAVLPLACAVGDTEHPLLLALRLVRALPMARSAGPGPGPGASGAGRGRGRARSETDALAAVEAGDPTAMGLVLGAAVASGQAGGARPMVVVIEDAEHADADSFALLGGNGGGGLFPPDVRLLVTVAERGAACEGGTGVGGDGGAESESGVGNVSAGSGRRRPVERLAGELSSYSLVLRRLGEPEVAAMVAGRLQATPQPDLVRRVHQFGRGVPTAVDALLTGWVREGAIRVADGHAFLSARVPEPLLPDDHPLVAELRALGEPYGTVAGALSILWPLGRAALTRTAAVTGLSAEETRAALRALGCAGIVTELKEPAQPEEGADGSEGPCDGGRGVRGWMFCLPLVEHTVREGLGPLERARLSAAAVSELWGEGAGGERLPAEAGGGGLLAEADAVTYPADRIADAGVLVDRDRAVDELVRTADRLLPDVQGPGLLRYLGAALDLIEDPGAREHVLLRYAKAAYVVGDYARARATGEEILRDPADSLTDDLLQDVALLLVAATAASEDWAQVSRMASAHWWRDLPLPPIAALTGQALALGNTEQWSEARDVLVRTEPMWRTGTREQWNPEWFRVCAEWVLGRPERFAQLLSTPYGPDMTPDSKHALSMAAADQLLGARDLHGTTRLLAFRGLSPEWMPPYTRFLWLHLQGRWDEALAVARWMLANQQAFNPAPSHHLLPARTAAMLLAKGRATSARRLLDSARGVHEGPLELFLDQAEAEVLRALGEAGEAERILRRALAVAGERGHAYGTDELWALLAELLAEAGRIPEAADALADLETLTERTGGERTRLLWLSTSARVAAAGGPGGPDWGQERLPAAVELARAREQPFETAVVLVSAARSGAGYEELLYEAYDLFGEVGAALWRFHARTAMREAGLAVPDRRQVTVENEQLLATLITEGLSNRRIASVLRVSEDAVANRLTRLLSRTGLRSRTEVATAVLTSSAPAWPVR
ncbi:AAA family ATPase [Streptomyces sp. NPDC060053]|uniref:AAA family ATPase n=1 Tax=Streptomyces sp. NPDC060053 TaxID=3347047 RepID=UPI00367D9795